MKLSDALVLATFLAGAPALHAQDPAASPTNSSPSAQLITSPEQTVLGEPRLEPGEEPLPSMDGSIPGDANLFGEDLLGPGTGSYAPREPTAIPPRLPVLEDPLEAERKMRIRLRRIMAELDRDPRLVELRETADRAPTPEDRRAARRAYYTLFFDKVRRADASLTKFVAPLERKALAELYQSRVEPTVPLSAPPAPQPSAKLAAQLQDPWAKVEPATPAPR